MLSTAFGGLMLWGLYAVIWTTGGWWWLVAAGLFFVVSVVAGQLIPVLIMPLFYKVQPIDNPDLLARLARLAAGTGLSIAGVYRFDLSADTVKANAMLAGLGRTRRVLMGDTLLARFTPDEIEVIFAHEIGHHVFRHIRKMIAGGAVYTALGFALVDRLVMAWVHSADPAADYAHFPIDTLPLIMLVLTLFSLLLEPLPERDQPPLSSRQSDRYAARRAPAEREAVYISAFQKLARLNKDDPAPHWLEVFWFHSHPPIAERLAWPKNARARRTARRQRLGGFGNARRRFPSAPLCSAAGCARRGLIARRSAAPSAGYWPSASTWRRPRRRDRRRGSKT